MIFVVLMILLTATVYFALTPFKAKFFGIEEIHLPKSMYEADKLEARITKQAYKETRTWEPLTSKFKNIDKRIPLPLDGIKRNLLKAGAPMGLLEFLAFKALLCLLFPVLGMIFAGGSFSKDMVLIVSFAIGFLVPDLWLKKRIKTRQHRIRRDLPNIIDLLNLCVSGGLDFMLAVNRVVKDLKTSELTQELSEVYRETQMGKSRREALKNFAFRVDMPEIHSFVRTLVQADRMGTPMSEALNLQSAEIRVRRFQYGESMALKAPIKLLFPLFAFILPVVLIIVGGPIILQFMRGNMGIGF